MRRSIAVLVSLVALLMIMQPLVQALVFNMHSRRPALTNLLRPTSRLPESMKSPGVKRASPIGHANADESPPHPPRPSSPGGILPPGVGPEDWVITGDEFVSEDMVLDPVSYTHLTLPTTERV